MIATSVVNTRERMRLPFMTIPVHCFISSGTRRAKLLSLPLICGASDWVFSLSNIIFDARWISSSRRFLSLSCSLSDMVISLLLV